MDFVSFFVVIQTTILSVLVWLVWRNRSTQTPDAQATTEWISQLSLALSQQQTKLFSDLTTSVSQNGTKQQAEIALSQQKIEQRFGELQLKNQEQLQKMQQELQVTLRSALEQMVMTTKNELNSIQVLTKSNLDIINKANQEKLTLIQSEIERKLNENLAQNLKSFESVTKNLTEMQSTAGKMIDSTRSIDKLNSIFERTSSKAFGDFGERYLESILEQHLDPSSWSKQATLTGSQDRIDFIIHIGEKTIGIDCKFPVTKYQDYLEAEGEAKKSAKQAFLTTVKTMAQDIAQKYYKNEQLDALLLYLPSDGMFAEVVSDPQTLKHLQKYKVTPSSPATLFPLIMLMREYQFKQRVNDNAEEIIKGLSKVRKNVLSFREEFRKLGDKLRQAQTNYESADRSLLQVQGTVERLELTSEEQKLLEEDNPPLLE